LLLLATSPFDKHQSHKIRDIALSQDAHSAPTPISTRNITESATQATTEAMSANILPYDPRWVTKLLRRDMHNLKTKITKKIKARFSSSPSPCKALTHPREQFDVVIVEPDRPRSIESTVSSTRSEVSTCSSLYHQPILTSP
jgi:hypothetical protein